MGILNFVKKDKNDLGKLLKERIKQEKKLDKEWNERFSSKYTNENLKAAKNLMISNAMTIDKLEYEKLTKELKDRLNSK